MCAVAILMSGPKGLNSWTVESCMFPAAAHDALCSLLQLSAVCCSHAAAQDREPA